MSDQQIIDLPLARFYQLVRVATKESQREEYRELEKRAWSAWQTNLPHWGEPVGFDKWKEIIGLDQTISGPEDNVSAEDALAIARKIMDSDKKRVVS